MTDISRIVSVNRDITETLFHLVLATRSWPMTSAPCTLLKPSRCPRSATHAIRAEGILSFNPTVVIGDDGPGPPGVLDQVWATGVSGIIVSSDPVSLYGVVDEIQQFGTALGIPAETKTLATDLAFQLESTEVLAATRALHPRVAFPDIRSQGTQMIAGMNPRVALVTKAPVGIKAECEVLQLSMAG